MDRTENINKSMTLKDIQSVMVHVQREINSEKVEDEEEKKEGVVMVMV